MSLLCIGLLLAIFVMQVKLWNKMNYPGDAAQRTEAQSPAQPRRPVWDVYYKGKVFPETVEADTERDAMGILARKGKIEGIMRLERREK